MTPGNIRLIGAFGHLVVFLYCSSPIPLLLLTSLWRHNGVTKSTGNIWEYSANQIIYSIAWHETHRTNKF